MNGNHLSNKINFCYLDIFKDSFGNRFAKADFHLFNRPNGSDTANCGHHQWAIQWVPAVPGIGLIRLPLPPASSWRSVGGRRTSLPCQRRGTGSSPAADSLHRRVTTSRPAGQCPARAPPAGWRRMIQPGRSRARQRGRIQQNWRARVWRGTGPDSPRAPTQCPSGGVHEWCAG